MGILLENAIKLRSEYTDSKKLKFSRKMAKSFHSHICYHISCHSNCHITLNQLVILQYFIADQAF